ncbi:3-keto-5-aminohexanoate cleavage protein [Halodurantibacterium flavum]|uniref:3-keto-5-aminohexanoate cleavage protein n=1 Tax=Halodurantibacterium flavum TaxID=1382802 RepID=A0ABW4RZF1_9RHOB
MTERSAIICAAINGARRTSADHPALPVTPDGILREARACYKAGAAMLHLHVRDGDGRHSLDGGLYAEALAALEELDMVIQITTEAAGRYAPEAQAECLARLTPAQASVSVREIARDAAVASRLYRDAAAAGTEIQHILYDDADLQQLTAWQAAGIVPSGRLNLLFVLGRYQPAELARAQDVPGRLRDRPADSLWSVCAFGQSEAACAAMAFALGGHVRVGFENNLHLPDGRIAPDNAALVANAAALAHAIGVRPATPAEARAILSRNADQEL